GLGGGAQTRGGGAKWGAKKWGADGVWGAGKGGPLGADKEEEMGGNGTAATDRGVARQHQPELATAGARRAPDNRGARRYPVAPSRQPIFRFENRAAGNGRRLTQLAEKRRRHRLGGEFPVLVAVADRIKHVSLGRHIPGAGVRAVALGKPPNARLPGDDRPIGRVSIGVMHRAVAEFMVAEHAATGNDHLELVGLVEVRPGDGARTL